MAFHGSLPNCLELYGFYSYAGHTTESSKCINEKTKTQTHTTVGWLSEGEEVEEVKECPIYGDGRRLPFGW